MFRYGILIVVALSIDALQAFLSFGLFGLGGAVSGATFGIAAPIAMPLAIGLSFVIDMCMSVTLGAGLLLLLAHNGMFYTSYALGGGIAELIPGFDVVPAWTAMTIMCIVKKMAEEKAKKVTSSSGSTVFGVIASTAGVGTLAGIAANQNQSPQGRVARAASEPSVAFPEEQTARVAIQLKNIEGIRPRAANDNAPIQQRYAA